MALDRGKLAKIDRRVFAELGHAAGMRAVKVPVSDAAWSTWRRYCEAVGLTMGEAVAGLIDHELRTVVDESASEDGGVFTGRAEEQLAGRESLLAAQERQLVATEERLRGWTERLRIREGAVRAAEQRFRTVSSLALRSQDVGHKVGRNVRCPCGSDLKYKHCHGLADR